MNNTPLQFVYGMFIGPNTLRILIELNFPSNNLSVLGNKNDIPDIYL